MVDVWGSRKAGNSGRCLINIGEEKTFLFCKLLREPNALTKTMLRLFVK